MNSTIPKAEYEREWFVLWWPIIQNIQKLPSYTNSRLLKTLSLDNTTYNWRTFKHLTEYALRHAKNAQKIFSRISTRLHDDFVDHNKIIDEVCAELRAIPFLNHLGVTELVYTRKQGVDFEGKLRDKTISIEVTYSSSQKKLRYLLKNTYARKTPQLNRATGYYKILLIITKRMDTDSFWQINSTIQSFLDQTHIPTIVLGAAQEAYFSKKIKNVFEPFNREEYLTLAFGFDAKKKAREGKVIEKKIAEIFFKEISKE